MSHRHADNLYNANQLYRNPKDKADWYNSLSDADRKQVDEWTNPKPKVPKPNMRDNKIMELRERAKNTLDNLMSVSLEPEDDLQMLDYSCQLIDRVTEFVTCCLKRVADKIRQPDDDEVNR